MDSGSELNHSVTQSPFMMQHLQDFYDPSTIQLHDVLMVNPYTAQGQVPYQMCSNQDVHSVPGWMPYRSLEVQQPSPIQLHDMLMVNPYTAQGQVPYQMCSNQDVHSVPGWMPYRSLEVQQPSHIQLQDMVKVEPSVAHMSHHWFPTNMVSGCTLHPTVEYQIRQPYCNHLKTEHQAASFHYPAPFHAINQVSVAPPFLEPPPPQIFYPKNVDHAHVGVQTETAYTVPEPGSDLCMPPGSLSDLAQGGNEHYNPSSQLFEDSANFFYDVVNDSDYVACDYKIFGDEISSDLENLLDDTDWDKIINLF